MDDDSSDTVSQVVTTGEKQYGEVGKGRFV